MNDLDEILQRETDAQKIVDAIKLEKEEYQNKNRIRIIENLEKNYPQIHSGILSEMAKEDAIKKEKVTNKKADKAKVNKDKAEKKEADRIEIERIEKIKADNIAIEKARIAGMNSAKVGE